MTRRRSDIVVAVVLISVLVLILWFALSSFLGDDSASSVTISGRGDVALVTLEGMIVDSRPVAEELKTFADRTDVKAIVLRIESPGGIVAASQEIYDAVRRVRDTEKPIVVSMGSMAASGGYYAALGADSILANPGTITGSIGVLMDFPEITKLMQKIGVEVHSVTSGPLKNAGSPYEDWDAAEEEYFTDVVMDSYNQFVQVVAKERNMDPDRVRELASGRVYTGSQAVANGLIDRLGGLYEATHLAAELAGIEGEPKVVEPVRRPLRLWDLLFGDMEQAMNRVFRGPLLEYRMRLN